MRSLLRRLTVVAVGTVLVLSATPSADALVLAKYRMAGVIQIEEDGSFLGVGRINVCFGTPEACTTARQGVYILRGKAGVVITPPNLCVLSLGDGTMTIDWRQNTPNTVLPFTIQTFAAHNFAFIGEIAGGTFEGSHVQVAQKLRGLLTPCVSQRLGVAGQFLVEDLPLI